MKALTSAQLLAKLATSGVPLNTGVPLFIRDAEYAVPTSEWILGGFSHDLTACENWLRSRIYRRESNDCDDFARRAAWLAGECHNQTLPAGAEPCGLAFGEFLYFKDGDPEKGHAINFAIVDEDERLFFYEPQTQKEVTLTDDEKECCFGIIV